MIEWWIYERYKLPRTFDSHVGYELEGGLGMGKGRLIVELPVDEQKT